MSSVVTVKQGNLFESSAQTLVNTVNCVGIMGKGIALEFKNRFPAMFTDYKRRCKAGQVKLGRPYLYSDLVLPWVLNFPTKDHWRSVSRLSDIEEGLEHLRKHYGEWGIESLAVPPLGCGHGQLDWEVVGPVLYRHLTLFSIPIELYAPYGAKSAVMTVDFLKQASAPAHGSSTRYRVQPSWIALVEILHRLEQEAHSRAIGRTTFQKIAFVATRCKLPTNLKYYRASYGPFAEDLKKVTTALINHGLIEEKKLGRMFQVRVGPSYGEIRVLYGAEIAAWEKQIARITDLFLRVDTSEAELIATVLFASDGLAPEKQGRIAEQDVLDEVMDWKKLRRPKLEVRSVADTIRNLNMLRWLDVHVSPELPVSDPELYA
ncbi:MAG: macro domain-containing protein [candidate division Zixibacteria bacterium]|nr:macro domain-containing protein [candidate division Zixibacteria bacterium]